MKKKEGVAKRSRKMGNVLIWLPVFVLLIISAETKASDSILIKKTDQAYVFVDNESINHISTNIVRAQIKYFFHTMEPFKSKYLDYYLSYCEFDCSEKRIKVLQKVFYYTDYTSDKDDKEYPWSNIAPDTVESVLFEYVCNYNNRTKPSSNHQEVVEKSSETIKPSKFTFTVQVGSFENITNAEDLKKRFNQKGYKAYIAISESNNKKRLYKVCIGEFSDKEKAKSLSAEIKNTEGLDSFVISK
jgi:hypothetical protein